jgi:hypothetical protein
MDVTHISEFGRSRFVHVTIDTFSHFISAIAHTGVTIKDVIAHCFHTFSVIGIPRCIRMDTLWPITLKPSFNFVHFGISLETGIPCNQGINQEIVERTHQTLKAQLSKQKRGIEYTAPANRLLLF